MTETPPEHERDRSAEIISRDRAGFLGNVGLAVSFQAAAFAAGLACMIVTTRLLGPAGYGLLAVFFLVQEVFAQLFRWANLSLVRFGREELGDRDRLGDAFWARVAIYAASLALSAALLFAFRKPLNAYLGLDAPTHVLLLCYVALHEAVFLLRTVFQTTSDFRAYSVTAFGVRALNLVFITAAFIVVALPASPGRILGAHLASMTIVLVAVLVLLPWRRMLPVRFSAASLTRASSYSWPLILSGMSCMVVDWIDLVTIRHYHAPEAVGRYAVAYQPVTVLLTINAALVSVILPMLVSFHVKKRVDALRWYLEEALPQAACAVGLGCTLLGAVAEAIPLVLGETYRPSVAACQMLVPGIGFAVVASLLSALFHATNRVRVTVFVTVILACANAGLDILWVPRIGIVGAALATTIAYGLSCALFVAFSGIGNGPRGDAARGRCGILIGLLPAAIFAGAVATIGRPAIRLAICAAILAVACALARFSGVFRRTTLERLDGVRMPGALAICIRLFYRILGR